MVHLRYYPPARAWKGLMNLVVSLRRSACPKKFFGIGPLFFDATR